MYTVVKVVDVDGSLVYAGELENGRPLFQVEPKQVAEKALFGRVALKRRVEVLSAGFEPEHLC